MNVILITPHRKDEWDGGDSVITHGLFRLMPELLGCELIFSEEIPYADTDDAVGSCDYIIHAGTPSWHRTLNRRFWIAAIKHNKRITMLGIGLAVPYNAEMWYGSEAFVGLRDSGLIDLIVCRDKLCHYWLTQRLGFDSSRIQTLPCPGFFLNPPHAVEDKTRVIVSVCNPEETGKETQYTFQDYFEKTRHLIGELANCGAMVSVIYQRAMSAWFEQFLIGELGVERIHSFATKDGFSNFIDEQDIYIGVRNHGALPCAGAGKPSLLLGTDYRQALVDEIPFISKIDISHKRWEAREVVDWYRSVEPDSRQLLSFRSIAESRWSEATHHIRRLLSPCGAGTIQNDVGVVLETGGVELVADVLLPTPGVNHRTQAVE